jgi:hypothetical protein
MPSEIIYGVFVSSTYEDLREERAAVQKALLQLHCMPIGMELFGSADEETWEFIGRQIDNCDYYVAVIADKYGSTATDGFSYTEKEYEYAREIGKPVLAFVHGDRGSIPRAKTESDAEKRSKLEAFIEKVRLSPVSFFTTPYDLATQVTVSFVNLRDRRPAVGFIRADQAPDLKKYTELLEENARLQAEVSRINEEPKIEVFSDPEKGCLVTPIEVRVDFGSMGMGQSQATSVRVGVQAITEVGPQNVTAYLTKLERKTETGWEESRNREMVPLKWAGTDTLQTEISHLFPKFVGVLHIDRHDNLVTVPGVPFPLSFTGFFTAMATYRVTVSVMAEGMTSQTRFEVNWKGQWDTIEMRPSD